MFRRTVCIFGGGVVCVCVCVCACACACVRESETESVRRVDQITGVCKSG